ncbi:MAG: hypothetical protein WCG03_11410, partial [Kiritimatiellales bacterium]
MQARFSFPSMGWVAASRGGFTAPQSLNALAFYEKLQPILFLSGGTAASPSRVAEAGDPPKDAATVLLNL